MNPSKQVGLRVCMILMQGSGEARHGRRVSAWRIMGLRNRAMLRVTILIVTVIPIKLETGLRPNSAGIPYTLLLRIEAIGFPTFRLLLYS